MLIGRGDVGEAAVLLKLLRHGFVVLRPHSANIAYDLAVDDDVAGLVRIQCKTAWFRDGVLIFNSCSTDHGHGRRDYCGRADVFGVYSPKFEEVFMVPVDQASTRATRLRVDPTRNAQSRKVRFAASFRFDAWAEMMAAGRLSRRLTAAAP